MNRLISILFRLAIPLGILAAGGYAYTVLSVEPDEAKSTPPAKQIVRTRVTRLTAGEYPVIVRTNGIVQAHNSVTLSAEVSGRVSVVSSNFDVGVYFSEGDVLVELDDRDYRTALAVAKARHKVAESARQLAAGSHERTLQLLERNVATEAEMDQSAATLAQALAEVETAAAQIEQAQRDLERTKVLAPFDGRVQRKSVGPGQLVSPGTVLGQVFAVDYAEVRLPLANRGLRFLKLPEMDGDDAISVELRDAIDAGRQTVWNAQIVRTEGTLDEDSLELFAIARIEDPFGLKSKRPILRIGQPVAATIKGTQLQGVVALPRKAVRQLDRIFLVDEDSMTLKAMTVEPVWTDNDNVVVRDASLANGALLATTQLVYAPEGGKVEIIPDVESAGSLATVEVTEK